MRKALALAFVAALLATPAVAACAKAQNGKSSQFVLKGGEAFDAKTGLIWKRCSAGKSWNGKTCSGEFRFMNLSEATKFAAEGEPGWRLPTVTELASLLDKACGEPQIDLRVFPDVEATFEGSSPYWTTSEVGMINLVYYVDFMSGIVDGRSGGFAIAARLVRPAK